MRRIHFCAFIFAHVWCLCSVEAYRTFSMKVLGSCSSNSSVEIKVSPMSWNSSGILISDWSTWYEPHLHCEVTLNPPPSYGVVVSIRTLNLLPRAESPSSCQNYLEISSVRGFKNNRICGFSNDPYEFKSYIYWGRTNIVFHTSNTRDIRLAGFELTFTVVRRGYNWCFKEEKRCHNGHCIWKGLICDGHNNCGDLSDEMDSFIAQCSALSSGESLAVILVTIVGALVLLTIAAYLRGPKISQQIGRLSQCRRVNCPRRDLPGPNAEGPSINAVPTIRRMRTNYGSMGGLLSSYDYSAAPPLDPPPRYDEVESLPVTSVQSSVIVQVPAANSIRSTNVMEVIDEIGSLPIMPIQSSVIIEGPATNPTRSEVNNEVESPPATSVQRGVIVEASATNSTRSEVNEVESPPATYVQSGVIVEAPATSSTRSTSVVEVNS